MQIETNLYKSLNNKYKIVCLIYKQVIAALKVFWLFIGIILISFLLFWFKSTQRGSVSRLHWKPLMAHLCSYQKVGLEEPQCSQCAKLTVFLLFLLQNFPFFPPHPHYLSYFNCAFHTLLTSICTSDLGVGS